MANIDQKRFQYSALKQGTTWDTEVDTNEAEAGIEPDNPGVFQHVEPPIECDDITGPNENELEFANINPSESTLDFSKLKFNGKELCLLSGLFGSDSVEPLFVVIAGTNNFIDFKDTAAATKAAQVAAGSYTGTTLATAIAAAMMATTPTGTFTCTWSAATGKFTIAESSGPTNFELLWNTGTNKAKDIHTLCGYSDAADDTGAATYASDIAAPGSGAYQHTLSMDDDIDGVFFTYSTPKGSKMHVVPSIKPMKAAFSFNTGMIKCGLGVRGSRLIDNSAIVTTYAAVTTKLPRHRAKVGATVFRMNDQTGDALDSGDVVKVKQFGLDFERKADSEHGSSAYTIMEPRSNDKPQVNLNLEFQYVNAVNELYFADFTARTEKKIDITITGPTIVGTHTYSIQFILPRLKISKPPEMPDSGLIPLKLDMRALQATSAPTGMTVTKPLTCIIVNTISSAMVA